MVKIKGIIGKRITLPILNMLKEHLRVTCKVAELFKKAIETKIEGENPESIIRQIAKLENKADEIRRRIASELTRGVLPPLSGEDLIHLTRRVDQVTDWINEAARFLALVEHIRCEELAEKILNLTSIMLENVRALDEALETLEKNIRDAVEKCNFVERIEHEADMAYMDAMKVLVKTRLEAGEMIVLERMIVAIENACDSCENASDILKVIVTRVEK